MKITDKKKHRPQRDCKEKAWDDSRTCLLYNCRLWLQWPHGNDKQKNISTHLNLQFAKKPC